MISPNTQATSPAGNLTDALGALLAKARDAENAGDLAGARQLVESAPTPLRAFGSLHYARGAMALRSGDLATAIEAFEWAVQLEPEIPEFHGNLGAALLERTRRSEGKPSADLARAVRVLTHAAGLSPKLPQVHGNLGAALLASGEAEAALQALDAALAIDGRDVTILYNRAAALHALGRERDCLECLDALLKIDPGFAPALESRQRALRRPGSDRSEPRA